MPLLGGVRPPIWALTCLLVAVAALTAIGLGTVRGQDVPHAASVAERRIATDTAELAAASIDANAEAVRHSTRLVTPTAGTTPAAMLRSLLLAAPSAQGGALFDPDTRSTLATSGEPMPLTSAQMSELAASDTTNIAPRLATSMNGEPRLLLFAQAAAVAAESNRRLLLVVAEKLAVPSTSGDGRTGQLLDPNGKVLTATSTAPLPAATEPNLAGAAANAETHASGGTVRQGPNGLRRITGWATVTSEKDGGDASRLGLTVLTFKDVTPVQARADHVGFATATAGALTALAGLLATALRRIVQLPLLRLHLSAARLAGAVRDDPAARQVLAQPVAAGAFGELARTARALESIRRQLLGETGPQTVRRPARRRPGVRFMVVGCVLVIAAWGLPMLLLLNRVPAAAIPDVVVADQQARTEAAAARLQLFLGQSATDLASTASALSGQPQERAAKVLRRELADRSAYRSLYVLDRSGAVSLRVGKEPVCTLARIPTGSGIVQINTSGRIPAIAVYAQIPPADAAKDAEPAVLFAEIDVNAVGNLLSRPGLGSVWLTDRRNTVLAASVGFQAFQPLPSGGLVDLAGRVEAQPGHTSLPAAAVQPTGSALGTGLSIAASAPLTRTGPGATLGWQVISAEPAAGLELTAYQVQDRTMLVGILALTVGLACLSWLHIVVVRPLRALAACAERLARGDRRTVLYPVHHDECGSVVRSLELLRQALVQRDRPGALGPAGAQQVPA